MINRREQPLEDKRTEKLVEELPIHATKGETMTPGT